MGRRFIPTQLQLRSQARTCSSSWWSVPSRSRTRCCIGTVPAQHRPGSPARWTGPVGRHASAARPVTDGEHLRHGGTVHTAILPAEYLRLAAIWDWRRVGHRSSSSGSGRDQLDCPGSAGGVFQL